MTVEIKRLKEELRRYRHAEDGALRKQRLFEVKTHGLPQWKKRELEATLREFAMGVSATSSTEASSSMRKKSSRHSSRGQGSRSMSKHAPSSSYSHLKPVDSAYASMSAGNTSAHSMGRHSKRANSRDTEQKVEDYLKDIPEGLYPRHISMSDKEKKKLVVRRLEQLFTGKAKGKRRAPEDETPPDASAAKDDSGPSREARILPTTNPKGKTASAAASGSATQSNLTSHSNTDLTSWSGNKSGGNDNVSGGGSNHRGGNGNGSSSNISPTSNPPFEQRPTRLRDLDPDRMPDPSENMEYLRHLGVTGAAEGSSSVPRSGGSPTGVAADADGWVYLNLLCNLAQLHIFNVSPSFVRAAVAEKSAKFQLSSDGRKIRWRGGTEGTAFSSESSGQGSGDGGEEGSSGDGPRKRRKTGSDEVSGDTLSSERETSEEERFHYKPLFARGKSPAEERTSQGSSGSSGDSGEDSYYSGSGENSLSASKRRKRRIDGAIIYYSGAPFCTDLSGDPGYLSPNTYMVSSGEQDQERQSWEEDATRTGTGGATLSGSSLAYRPLNVARPPKGPESEESLGSAMDTSSDVPVVPDEADSGSEIKAEFPWSDSKDEPKVYPFEPCGLGGVIPEDHFVMTITTKRPKENSMQHDPRSPVVHPKAQVAAMVERVASKTYGPSSRAHPRETNPLEIKYVSGRLKRLRPSTLPPPAVFIPPFSSSGESSDWSEEDEEDEEEDDDGGMSSEPKTSSSQRVNPHHSDKSFRVSDGASSDVEDDTMEDDEGSLDAGRAGTATGRGARGDLSGRNEGPVRRGSLVATAGGESSGYSSSKEVSS